ncbi:MAG: toprim domain-containing protein [Hyphomicrobiaceae bacterium]
MMLTTRRIAERLSFRVEFVCAYYLSNGRKEGNYWLVGDVHNTPGRSLYVRLIGPTFGAGAAGKWTDAATGEHGDLLDLIRLRLGLHSLREARSEALRFLSEPVAERKTPKSREPVPSNSIPAARRLFAASKPLAGTLAETYLRARGITCSLDLAALRFHPRCYHREVDGSRAERPALVAAITDLAGDITAVQRIYLAPDGGAKAAIKEPRRSMGDVLGHAIRLGIAGDVLAAGEGLETMLALRSLLPALPVAAATSANHLAAMSLHPALRRLYIAHDHGRAGRSAAERLMARAMDMAIDAQLLSPMGDDDWNTDLMTLPVTVLREALLSRLDPQDTGALLDAA